MSNDAGKSYKFNMQNGVITGVFEIENGYLKAERLDANETWSVQGNQVVKTEYDDGRIETTTYTDLDGDGLYVKASEVKTLSGTGVATSFESHGDEDGHAENSHDSRNEGGNDDDNYGASSFEHTMTVTPTPQRDTPRTTGTGTVSDDHPDEVSDGDDGYEYHHTSESDHELHGSELHDSVLAGALGDDRLHGGSRDDVMDGDDGSDTLDGNDGDDILVGGGESDRGHNHFNGGSGDDILIAGGAKTHSLDNFLKANPVLSTALTNDAKYASLATLVRGTVDDSGGAMNTFELDSGNGHDAIFNFHASSDKLEIHRGINGSDIQDTASLLRHVDVSGDHVTIDLGNGNSVTLVGIDVEHMSEANLAWI